MREYMREYMRALVANHRLVPIGSLPCKDRTSVPRIGSYPVSCRSIEFQSRIEIAKYRAVKHRRESLITLEQFETFVFESFWNTKLWRVVLFQNIGNSISPKKTKVFCLVCFFFLFKWLLLSIRKGEGEINFNIWRHNISMPRDYVNY